MTFTLHGIGISGGYAIGRAQLYSHDRLEVPHYVLRKADVGSEVTRFDAAVAEVRAEYGQLRDHIPEGAPSELAAFLDLHALILDDTMISQAPKGLIRQTACNAEWALAQQTEALLAQFESFEDAYLRERQQDVKQVADKLLKALLGHPGQAPLKVSDEPTVLVAHDLSPSDMVLFKRHAFAGFITDLGGTTSHTAILARSLNISSVMALHNARSLIQEGDVLIVDGIAGVVIVNPDQLILEEYQLRSDQWRLEQQKLKRLKSSPSATLDGEAVELLGNIDLPQDVFDALDENAAGIGLFRSEFLFMNRPDLPPEDEQFEAYRDVAAAMKGRPVVIRTLDSGADKSLDWMSEVSVNPALGLRAIRFCLAEPRLFVTQLRAILRASHYGQVRILIPMLSSLDELDQALELIALAKAELAREGQPFNPGVPIGGMVEIPAAALVAEWFAQKLDFLSIGTNDLIQYTLAIDRTDDAVAHLYDPLHPAVLQLLAHTLKVGHRLKRPVSVCGEMAGDPKMTRLLLGLGLRSFSMHPAHLMAVKQQIMHSHLSSLAPLAAKLLRAGRPDRIQGYLERINAL
ncbi:MAG: phosphoenolpyruvate--protein phosphotransferase [Hydrogenophilales bacterium CG03_land_8_20_14_0_80_62_28]|nr:phosphoenolpyruvate--protein phosphotransferase [Betaproteobacteria bacterium]OIO77554.1 MAG: phosphoenolpyruvate--protein phosphotransferase [Hydrogenophilaceae bacterium CG1_02_62_390]PIV22194.1 MAG: phosphoenolpyruvate--protein phosphotransferase [Hydrogenophilales bacterium CG03_land_8_20_14_0_80_62_28]PIW38625.1 MAG: phosphoenolpyruvate--protein phosphotransferase [Hydrogenophilales bacterium CG15_BIG_FIL_POST_REV_8_21_14_020_62_31]PIW72505.1 MAG: phosphoenolpyruvate--protein phosphotra